MKKYFEIFFLGFIGCILAACQMLPSAIFQNETCSPPCWNGVIPGKTLFKDINAKMNPTPSIDSKSIKTISFLQSNDGISFSFLPNVRENGGRIFSQDGIVQAILFWPKSNEFLLSEGLQNWGSPDQYISIYYSKVETPYLITIVTYINRGIILESRKAMSIEDVPKFENNLPIDDFWYINPELTNSLLENGPIAIIDKQDLLDGLKPWTGLGEIIYLTKDH